MFKENVGTVDRALRIILGVALLIAFFALPEASYRWLFLIGIIPLATAFMKSCPVYSILGLSTCPLSKS